MNQGTRMIGIIKIQNGKFIVIRKIAINTYYKIYNADKGLI